MVGGSAILTLSDASAKWLASDYPVGEVIAIRSLFVVLLLVALTMARGRFHELRVRNISAQGARAVLACASTFLFVVGISYLPLADAIALSFVGPLFITALARPLLGEWVGWRRWLAVLVGFVGVLAMVDPTGDSLRWAALLPLTAAMAGALRDVLTRRISVTETSSSILLTSNLMIVVVGGLAAALSWRVPNAKDMLLLGVSGVLVGTAHFLHIEAFRLAEATLIAPFKYSTLVWGTAVGFLIWGHVPGWGTLFGTALVVGSGLYILSLARRQSVRSRQ